MKRSKGGKKTILGPDTFPCSNKLVDQTMVLKDDTCGGRIPRRLRERRGGNRDKVPSSRPVTSANDIQIPLGQRAMCGWQLSDYRSARSPRFWREKNSCRNNGGERKGKNGKEKSSKKRERLNREYGPGI